MKKVVYDTRLLGRIVSDIAGQEINMHWCHKRDLPDGAIAAANYEKIMIDEALARRSDPVIPHAIFHEMGHVLLHKRNQDTGLTLSNAEKESEATVFANEMSLRVGEKVIWDALTGDLTFDREWRLRCELKNVSELKTFKRNRIAPPYQRVSQGDVEMTHKGRKPAYAAQHSTRQAQELEAQARREHSLAAKVSDPKLKDLIRNSATGKLERAEELKTGRPVKASKYETRLEYGQPHHANVTARK